MTFALDPIVSNLNLTISVQINTKIFSKHDPLREQSRAPFSYLYIVPLNSGWESRMAMTFNGYRRTFAGWNLCPVKAKYHGTDSVTMHFNARIWAKQMSFLIIHSGVEENLIVVDHIWAQILWPVLTMVLRFSRMLRFLSCSVAKDRRYNTWTGTMDCISEVKRIYWTHGLRWSSID